MRRVERQGSGDSAGAETKAKAMRRTGAVISRSSRRAGPLAVLLCSLLCSILFGTASASGHFRFGTVSWAPNSVTNGVDFTLQLAYKKNYAWGTGLESWKADASDSGESYKSLATASTEDAAACNGWDKADEAGKPQACQSVTVAPGVGAGIHFPVKALPSAGQCADPLDKSPTADGCLPWSEVYGFFMGDGSSRAVDLVITESTEDVYSPLANYVVGKSVFSHTYAAADNGGEPWLAYFTGGDRDTSLMNNRGGRFRLEAQVKISGNTRSPMVSFMPIVPVPKTASTVQFQVTSYDLNDLSKSFTIRDGTNKEYVAQHSPSAPTSSLSLSLSMSGVGRPGRTRKKRPNDGKMGRKS